jgi:hypothetical protein
MQCEKYLIDFLNVENYHAISEQAELYNADRLTDLKSTATGSTGDTPPL